MMNDYIYQLRVFNLSLPDTPIPLSHCREHLYVRCVLKTTAYRRLRNRGPGRARWIDRLAVLAGFDSDACFAAFSARRNMAAGACCRRRRYKVLA